MHTKYVAVTTFSHGRDQKIFTCAPRAPPKYFAQDLPKPKATTVRAHGTFQISRKNLQTFGQKVKFKTNEIRKELIFKKGLRWQNRLKWSKKECPNNFKFVQNFPSWIGEGADRPSPFSTTMLGSSCHKYTSPVYKRLWKINFGAASRF